jgi:hypothetical protein
MRLKLIILFALLSIYCSSQVNNRKIKTDLSNNSDKILIVYLSRTNNTKAVAEIINKKVGGKLVAYVSIRSHYNE